MKPRASSSKLGILLAITMLLAGGYLVIRPVDMIANHPNMVPRGNTPSRFITPSEHVTPSRSKFYGSSLMLAGLALGVFSFYRPSE
jgi:hypothetical protein